MDRMSQPSARGRRLLTGGIVTWATVAGLGVVLAVFAAIGFGGALSGSRSAAEARRTGDLTAAYLRAQDGLSREDAIEDVYRLDPDPVLRRRFEAAVGDLDGALVTLLESGAARDRALARRARPLHDTYAQAMRDLFDAADRAEMARAEQINEERADPAQDELQRLIAGSGPDYALAQLRELGALEGAQRAILGRTALVVTLGVALYVLLVGIFVAYRRRLERAAEAELAASREQALTDDLTGLGNRRAFARALEALLARGEGLAVLLIDVDRFKEINDTLGHHAGDALLAQLARRAERTLPEAHALARLGGDEFVAVVPAAAGAREALGAADALLGALDEPFALEGLLAHVRASIGIALYPAHGVDGAELLRRADAAMYRAKATGGGTELYASGHDDHSLERVVLGGELRRALDSGELLLHYQPKADLATGGVGSVEALVRWRHPTRGLLPPAAFLPLAEGHGIMRPLTLHVLELAVAQAVEWERAGRPLRVAVNVAPASLIDVRFPDEVALLLDRHGAGAHLLQLEITEDTIMVDPVRVLDVVARLGELGLAFSLDDFGTGYSSLAYLKRLPVQELKIDRSFVMEMSASRDDDVIVRSTVDLARNLGLRVIAEGVESRGTWERLQGFGCHGAQGFFVSPPLPPDELGTWLQAHGAAVSPPSRAREEGAHA